VSAAPDNQVVLITGASQGLGAAIARRMHAAGHRVAISDLDREAAARLAAALDPSGRTTMGLHLDVRDPAQFEAARDQLLSAWGSVEALVNNAVATVVRPVLEIPVEEFDAVIAVNLRGVFIGSQVFGRHFKAMGYGRIVNIASLAGQNGGAATGAHYAASKGGVLTLTKVFARDLAAFGVTVNAIAPGPLDVPSVRALLAPEALEAVVKTIPVGALGDPDFVADLAVKLASREAGFVTGATWDVNGGLFMR
jgi:3-oxoacyl-[acyl-carrier protein] reductase